MKRFKTQLDEQREMIELQEVTLPFALDTKLANVARKSGITAVSRVLTDVFESGIRLVGRNPLKTTFFILALDQLVNSGQGRQALVNYLRGDFKEHTDLIIDAIFTLIENGVDSKAATGLVSSAIEAAS